MKLALPLGLIGLISIAALILIYIFKPKYQDRKVSSTYVWKLSLQYRKKKVPLQWLQSSLLLLIQILILALIAFTMAQPLAVLASKEGEKIVVLDASASMLTESGGESRFERAKRQIGSLAEETVPDDRFSIILASDEASFVIRRSDSEAYIKQKLFDAECGYSEPAYEDAMELAEGVLQENPSAEVYLYTDCDYLDSGSVKVVNLSKDEWNAAILDFKAELVKGRYVFTAEVASYGSPADLPVSISIDGKEQLSRLAECDGENVQTVVWDSLDIYSYSTAEVSLAEEDSYSLDNRFVLFNDEREDFRVQLVSNESGFLYWALSSVRGCNVTLVTEPEKAESSGFDLYVYNHLLPPPAQKPEDGAVWLVDPTADYASAFGFTIGGERNESFSLAGSGGNSEACRTVAQGITPSKINVTKFSEITSYSEFESIFTCDGSPVLLAKNDGGLKTLILAFDLHWSNLPLLADFPRLVNNMCSYCLAPTVEGSRFFVGDEVLIHTKPTAESVSVTSEYTTGGGNEEAFTEFPIPYRASVPGIYTVTQTLRGGQTVTDSFVVLSPSGESELGKIETALAVPIVPAGSSASADATQDTLDIYVYLAAAMLVLICIEWGLQYREQ